MQMFVCLLHWIFCADFKEVSNHFMRQELGLWSFLRHLGLNLAVDGSEIWLTSWGWWFIPIIYSVSKTSKGWLFGISESSTVTWEMTWIPHENRAATEPRWGLEAPSMDSDRGGTRFSQRWGKGGSQWRCRFRIWSFTIAWFFHW